MQTAPSDRSTSWPAFLELGFRPLYVAGCSYAAIAIALWIFFPQLLQGSLFPVAWHAHEMLWGFVGTIAVGFLFTASSNWTGINPLHGAKLAALMVLWLVARVSYVLPGLPALLIGTACELVFFAWSAAALLRVVHLSKNRRNYGVPLLVAALGGADAAYVWATTTGRYDLVMRYLDVAMMVMAIIALLIARRVIPFFASRAIAGLALPMHGRSGRWQLGSLLVAIVLGAIGWTAAAGGALAIAGAIAVKQLLDWKPWAVRRQPLLWILYAGYAGLAAGLLVASAHAAGMVVRAAWPLHVIGLAGFAVLIIGMTTRTALGHLGRPMRADRPIVAMYALVLAATALRLAALVWTQHAVPLVQLAAIAWIAAFLLYVARFLPMMARPRFDAGAVASAPVQAANHTERVVLSGLRSR